MTGGQQKEDSLGGELHLGVGSLSFVVVGGGCNVMLYPVDSFSSGRHRLCFSLEAPKGVVRREGREPKPKVIDRLTSVYGSC